VVVCDLYAAGEPPIPGVDSARLAKAMRDHGHRDVTYIPRREDVAAHLARTARAGDIVITLGAGDIQLSCAELLALIKDDASAAQ
jgi:UDP-N-acetylmuramate--alanine ligase